VRRLLRWLLALLVVPALLSVGWVAIYAVVDPPSTSIMRRDADAGLTVKHEWVPLERIGRNMPRAVIGAEDAGFCAHDGFDVGAMRAAVEANMRGRALRGGSTISQQTAKNVFLWPGRSYSRKALEAWFTFWIEALWGKPRIMEVYLNVAELGRGVYGVQAASRHYFGRDVQRLSRQQAARLAAILPQPVKRDAAAPGRQTRRYARRIEKRIRVVRDERIDACLWPAV
jgi:monofunctional biosynthetic peptidoglycan transglycosylase